MKNAMVKRVILCLIIFLSASVGMTQQDVYREPYRPQFHFSPICGWMNDPNGMVYYNGEYHLFYQYSPLVSRGAMHWGHALSRDLVHWQPLPIALYPDDIGPIWSGSAVVDANNTSGLVPGGGLVAIFSYENQSQGIAYSRNDGRTWTKYAGIRSFRRWREISATPRSSGTTPPAYGRWCWRRVTRYSFTPHPT